jgi:protein tyrosine phosphatase (PTP) superfamily phosphohydrolase (DUF442 family)
LRKNRIFQYILLSILFSCALKCYGRNSVFPEVIARPVFSTNLQIFFQASTNVFSGSAPESGNAFQEIKNLGVKTIITVDGARPDIETAHKYGLRYVHLPVGYGGISAQRQAELITIAKAANEPIYVHCHHGQHRGPAAVAVICEATAGWTTNQAVSWLKQAGTSPEYAGLYRSVTEFPLPGAAVSVDASKLPEIARESSLVDTMVEIDKTFDWLKAAQKLSWDKPPGAISAQEAASLLWEHFRELARDKEISSRPQNFYQKLATAEKAAYRLKDLLGTAGEPVAPRDHAFQTLGATCRACHKQYRD